MKEEKKDLQRKKNLSIKGLIGKFKKFRKHFELWEKNK